MSAPLHLVRLVLDRRALLRVGVQHRLGQEADAGSLLHAGLAQLFAHSSERAEVPLHNFALDDTREATAKDPSALFLLAYSPVDHGGLRDLMGPMQKELVRECASRALPTFEVGQRLGFRTRVCPVVRTHLPGDRPLRTDARGRTRGREMDAFVHATLSVTPVVRVDREAVYAQWLRRELGRDGASEVAATDVRMSAFRREAMRRRGGVRIERPDAVLEGTLTVTDPAAFGALLERGVGRHRAFGFGMLLLRPPSR